MDVSGFRGRRRGKWYGYDIPEEEIAADADRSPIAGHLSAVRPSHFQNVPYWRRRPFSLLFLQETYN